MNQISCSAYQNERGVMCLILDANRFSDFLNPDDQDMEPVRRWIKKMNGKFAFAPTEKLDRELKAHRKMYNRFQEERENGRVKLVDAQEVEEKIADLPELKSDDPDIVALALVSGVKLLVTGEQKGNLHKDFKKIARGKVYRRKEHHRLLRKDICP